MAWVRTPLVAGATALLLSAITAYAAGSGDHSEDVKRAIKSGHAKNVILLIGDGMGASEITIARNYTMGAAGKLAIDQLPLTGQMTTYSVQESNPTMPDYDPESASTGTAWATGQKTADGRISTAAGTDLDLPTILELAQGAGLRTGNITTADLTDATPAVLMSHVKSRSCAGPADMASCPLDKKSAGGPGSIAEQSVDHGVNVLLGGGQARYDQVIDGGPDAGKTVLQSAIDHGYSVVTDKAGMTAATGTKVLGLFTPSHMSMEWGGAPADIPATGPQRCNENLRPANEPSLDEMTAKAIELLTQKGPGDKGFFLQIESASIDKRDHDAMPCEQIGETVNFDRALQVALAFADRDKNTLVLVTADHAHTSQIVEAGSITPGPSSQLITDEGSTMQVTYGTSPKGVSMQHTGTTVPIAATGPQAANVVGLIDQTALFTIIKNALHL